MAQSGYVIKHNKFNLSNEIIQNFCKQDFN